MDKVTQLKVELFELIKRQEELQQLIVSLESIKRAKYQELSMLEQDNQKLNDKHES